MRGGSEQTQFPLACLLRSLALSLGMIGSQWFRETDDLGMNWLWTLVTGWTPRSYRYNFIEWGSIPGNLFHKEKNFNHENRPKNNTKPYAFINMCYELCSEGYFGVLGFERRPEWNERMSNETVPGEKTSINDYKCLWMVWRWVGQLLLSLLLWWLLAVNTDVDSISCITSDISGLLGVPSHPQTHW